MKIEYRSILERVNEVIEQAKKQDHEIEYIELCPSEWFSFRRSVMSGFAKIYDPEQPAFKYHNIEIRRGEYP